MRKPGPEIIQLFFMLNSTEPEFQLIKTKMLKTKKILSILQNSQILYIHVHAINFGVKSVR